MDPTVQVYEMTESRKTAALRKSQTSSCYLNSIEVRRQTDRVVCVEIDGQTDRQTD